MCYEIRFDLMVACKNRQKYIFIRNVRNLQFFTESVSGTVSSAAYHAGVNDCVLSVHHIISSDYNIDPETRIKLLDHISSWLYHNFDSQLPGHVMDLSAGSAPRSPLHQSRVEKHDPETTRTISSAITSPREITLSAPFTQSHPREHVTSTYANRGVQRQKSTQAVVEQLQHDSLRPREISSPPQRYQ